MQILLLGADGQLGWELRRTLASLGEIIAYDLPAIDLSEPGQAHACVLATKPQLVVNAAAYTNVDQAEGEREAAQAVNGRAPGELAEAAREVGAVLVHYSTDYVFDGKKGAPYLETDLPNPVNAYGASKLAGERAIQEIGDLYLIFRTSWVYSLRRPSFVTKVHGWARKHQTLRIVTDQTSKPTWARMLAEVTALLLARVPSSLAEWAQDHRGVYHLAGEGAASRYDWARAILKYDPYPEKLVAREILPAVTADFPSPAQRPVYSVLDCNLFARTFALRIPPWEESLQLALESGRPDRSNE